MGVYKKMYEPLSKYFYKNKEDYKEKVKERMESVLTVKLDFMIGENQAFYVPTRELNSKMINIYKIDKRVSKIERELPSKALEHFSKKCLIDEIVVTNKIEGVHSTRKEIGKVLQEIENRTKTYQRFRGLITKYTILSKDSNIPLSSCEDVRNLYDELVLPEIKNTDKSSVPDGDLFRKDSVCVYSETQKVIYEGVNTEKNICDALVKSLGILNDTDLEVLIRIAAFHYFFGYIHPFYDGNGRISRFISSYLISKELEPLLAFRVSYTIHENIREYYKGFEICNDSKNMGDITPFLIMFLGIIEKSMEQLENALQKRSERLNYYGKVISLIADEIYPSDQGMKKAKKSFFSLSYILVQASLFSESGISKSGLIGVLSLSPITLTKYLKILNEKGMLLEGKEGREKMYLLNIDKIDSMVLDMGIRYECFNNYLSEYPRKVCVSKGDDLQNEIKAWQSRPE